jgi:hypothetical protein
MKKMTTWAICALIAVPVLLTSCNKDEDENNQTPVNNQTPLPSITGVDGVMAAINTSVVQNVPFLGETTTFLGLAAAAFYDGSGNLANAGTVSVNGVDLSSTQNSYVLTPGIANPTGITFGPSVSWEVTGGSGIPAFTHTYNAKVPKIGNITGVGSEITQSDLTVGIDLQNVGTDLGTLDSIIYMIAGPSGDKLITKRGNQFTHTFSAAEVTAVGKGQGMVQVVGYNLKIENKGGKNIAFVNEGVFNKQVTIK